MNDPNERLTAAERDALRALKQRRDPDPALEDRIVRTLIERGALRRGSRRGWLSVAAVAAAFVAGIVLGRLLVDTRPQDLAATPRFMLLLYENEEFERDDRHAMEYAQWAQDVARGGRFITGAEIDPREVSLPADGSRDRPEALAGYFVIGAEDLPAAVDVARTTPHLKYGGRVAVRALRAAP